MPTSTTNYALQKPLINNATDEDLWGGYLNDDLDDVDSLLRAGICIETQSSQTTGFTVSASISIKYLYPCNAAGGAFAATLPSASTAAKGATVYIKKTDSSSNAITVTPNGSDTIDGLASLAISTQYDCLGFVSDGTSKWVSLGYKTPAATQAEMEAASSTSVVVTPGRVKYSPNVAKVATFVDGTGSPVISGGFGLSSVSKTATGRYRCTFSTAFSDAVYSVVAIPGFLGSLPRGEAINIEAQTTTYVDISIGLDSVYYDRYFSMVIFGDQ